jgi:hypothetical protein
MSAITPFAASSFAPEERPQQLPAPARKSRDRAGRHEPIRSSTPRIAARGAVLGLTLAARDTAGSPDGGHALGLLGRVAVLRALL